MPRRYEVLDSIPHDLQFICERVDEADQLPPGDQRRTTSIMAAATKAQELLIGLTTSPPPWLALQRQFLVGRWSFNDLEDLDTVQVRALPIVEVLSGLHGSLPDGKRPAEDHAALVEGAWGDFGKIRDRAVEHMKASGLLLPNGSATIDEQAAREVSLVDETLERMRWLRAELAGLLAEASDQERQRQADEELSQGQLQGQLRVSEQRWRRMLKVCGEVVVVVSAITTVFVQAPEVWQELQPIAGELVRMVGELGAALSHYDALLGMVIVIRGTDEVLGPDPGGSIEPSAGPSGPLTGDLDGASVASPQQVTQETSPAGKPSDGDVGTAVDSPPQASDVAIEQLQQRSDPAPDPAVGPVEQAGHNLAHDPARSGEGDPSVGVVHDWMVHAPGPTGDHAPSGEELGRMASAPLPAEPRIDDDNDPSGPGLSPGERF